ncbi:MAG: UDP-N-acetylmuramoyl-L-alanine--D-glutamate ligase [Candidatus Saccharibacteria bacterium]|nr:UDP-N-acetylmuramoyl-L-alanine--D-glutamate ligase [Candidatus Saccharibacteria bacterium]
MKIAIAGYGLEGKQNYKYFNKPGNDLTIVDERADIDIPSNAKYITGDGVYDDMSQFDMVIRTAGLSPLKIKKAKLVWSATNEFFAKCKAPIIGVTGTKGKGTTSSFITSILRAAGKKVHLVGNIGVPALSVLPDIRPEDFVVYEMSSFQLWDIKYSPHIAVVLMIEPDHLDIHTDFEDYLKAKSNIRRWQNLNDICIYHPSNPFSQKIASVTLATLDQTTKGDYLNNIHRYGIKDDGLVYIKDDFFYTNDRKICPISCVKLPGKHNLENACAAMSAVLELKLDISDNQFAEGLRSFTGLPHRLKYVSEINNVKFYDDSISTTPGSAIAAIKSFTSPKVLILGGSYKGGDFTDLVKEIKKSNIRQIILMGDEANRIEQFLKDAGVVKYVNLERCSMFEIVSKAATAASPGDVIILSPACASFGMFKNYQDRGKKFINAVDLLKSGETI